MLRLGLIALLLATVCSVNGIGFRGFHFEGLKDPVVNTRATRIISEKWITQPVDHFNHRDNRTWSMRYYENDEFLDGQGPILIMLGGEWAISSGWLQTGQMYDIASQHGGMLYYTEHRYYGNSYPTDDTSSENMQYLNVDQALADVAYFIEAKKEERNLQNSTVVVVGGSYAGNMAAWARLKYPHLIKINWKEKNLTGNSVLDTSYNQGALASSAPVYAKADFYEYYEVVTNSLARHNPQCIVDVNEAFESVETLLFADGGPEKLKTYFNLCNDIDTSSSNDIGYFMNLLAEEFAGIVQYNTVGSSGETNIAQYCNIMTATYLGSPLQRLANLIRGSTCTDASYSSFLETYRNESWNSYAATSAMRPWFYQTCTEYGYYQTTTSDKSVFGTLFPIEFFHDLCRDLYGDYYDEDLLTSSVKRTNIVYGGWTPDVTNVIFTNGDIDPWHVLSVLQDLSDLSPAIVIDGASHCRDLYSDTSTDSEEMTAAKARVREIIGGWISS